MEGDRIIGGKYRLRREIGVGAMGSVWAADHELLGRQVAVKFLLPSRESAQVAAARFVAEAKAAARVKHRFVVDVFDFGITDDGLYYMVQELLEGASLADVLCEGPAWPLRDVLRFAADCLTGLEAVHMRGIIHRDLKPENIFVIRDHEGSHPKLLDFGISRSTDPAARHSHHSLHPQRASMSPGRARQTGSGTAVGTPAYMAPEQLRNANTMTVRADLYSVGVVLYEWLTGRVPYGDTDSPAELYRQIMERTAPPLHSLRPDLGFDLCSAIARALEPDADERFASAVEMRAELLRVLPGQPEVLAVVQQRVPPDVLGGAASALPERVFPLPAKIPVSLPTLSVPPLSLFPRNLPTRIGDSLRAEAMAIPGLGPSRTRDWMLLGGALAALALLAVLFFGRSPAQTAHRASANALREWQPSSTAPEQPVVRGVEPPPAPVALEPEPPRKPELVERRRADATGAGAATPRQTSRRRGSAAPAPVPVREAEAARPAASESSTSKSSRVVRTLDF